MRRRIALNEGDRFGRLTFLRLTEKGPHPKGVFLCDCGVETPPIQTYSVISGNTQSCGCLKRGFKPRIHMEPGTRFGQLTLIGEAGRVNPRVRRLLLRCDCGNLHEAPMANVRNGDTVSCGCYGARIIRDGLHATHGLSDRPEYPVWCTMIARCHRESDTNFARYGARGITVCDRWRESFVNFYDDMGPRPSPKHTVERRDNDGPYAPENCVWLPARLQARNKRNTVMATYRGETRSVIEWGEILGVPHELLSGRLRAGWDVIRAMEQPARRKPTKKPLQARSYPSISPR